MNDIFQQHNNVYNTSVTIGHYLDDDTNKILTTRKQYKDLTAEDIKNVDVWAPVTVEANYSQYRYQNQIPIWQRSMNIRHNDRDNEGFRHKDSDRASLNNQIHGYNMEEIYKASIDDYENKQKKYM